MWQHKVFILMVSLSLLLPEHHSVVESTRIMISYCRCMNFTNSVQLMNYL